MMNEKILEKFKTYYSILNHADSALLDEIYYKRVKFRDPIQEISGLQDLKAYFDKLNQNLIQGSTTFGRTIVSGNQVSIEWTMDLQLKKPKKTVMANGVSILEFDEKIVSQRDYFDAGELFYEHVPIMGGVIRFLKRRIA